MESVSATAVKQMTSIQSRLRSAIEPGDVERQADFHVA